MDKERAAEYKPYVIQFSGRIGLPERQKLEALGVILCEYLPGNAFLARMRDNLLKEVQKEPFVASVDPFGAEQKFSSGLVKALAAAPDKTGEAAKVVVKLFENAGAEDVVGFVLTNGGSVAGHDARWLEIELSPDKLSSLAQFHEVYSIEEKKEYELFNNRAGEIIRVPSLWNKGLTGAGQVIGIADTGLDTGVPGTMHPDFQDKATTIFALGRSGDASDFDGHGTHVAGSACGNGSASQGAYKGMAPEASLVFQSIMDKNGGLGGLPGDLGVLLEQAYEAGARIYNMSWGMSVNGVYNYASAQVDRFVWEHDDMAIAVAAGNTGKAMSISAPATAKNVITVGASENNRPEKGSMADNPAEMALFSSRGPAADGRGKPDIVAPGTWVLSTRSSLAQAGSFWGVEGRYYAYNGGTSMATPIVAGMLALVREYFIQAGCARPSAALLKAALLDGAFDLPGYARNDEGWGRLQAPGPLLNADREFMFVNQETKLATGESKVYEYHLAAAGGPLKVTLVWTDYPAQTNAAVTLVNDLDLSVQSPSGIIYSPGDHLNNVEQVVIPAPEAGTYKVTVSGYHVPMGYQHYALFVSADRFGQPDSEAPVVHITAPAAGSTVSGVMTVSAGASDNVAVTRVEFYLDGNLTGSCASPPFTLTVNTTVLANGVHTLTARAYDGAGNTGEDTVSFTVNNAAEVPLVSIKWPLEGVAIKGVIKFRANIISALPLGKVSFLVNGTVVKVYDYSRSIVPVKQISPYTTIDTTGYPNGRAGFKVQACDKQCNCGESTVFSTINNP